MDILLNQMYSGSEGQSKVILTLTLRTAEVLISEVVSWYEIKDTTTLADPDALCDFI